MAYDLYRAIAATSHSRPRRTATRGLRWLCAGRPKTLARGRARRRAVLDTAPAASRSNAASATPAVARGRFPATARAAVYQGAMLTAWRRCGVAG